jgi:exonuclease III
MSIKIGTLNICLRLPNKKKLVKQMILNKEIDVLCFQETEIEANVDPKPMSFENFNFESENNQTKSRVGCYVNSNLNYVRKCELEGANNHLVIIDIKSTNNMRIINIYRPFNPINDVTPRQFLKNQLNLFFVLFICFLPC